MKKIVTLLLSTVLAVSVISGCGKSATDTSNDPSAKDTSVYEGVIASLHAGQAYALAPICEGENALLVTSYVFDASEGHQGTYEATIYTAKDNSVEKVTTVQSGGTAYPIVVSDDNSLILSMRNSVAKGHVSKETGEFVITEESNVDYSASEDDIYHNYKDGNAEMVTDSSLFDELSDKYSASEVLNFTKAGIAEDGTPKLSGAVYAAYKGDDQYNVSSYYVFESETSGSTQTKDGVSGVPFTYELKGEDITFHFGSADDTTEGKFAWNEGAFPTITFTGDNETISLSCLGNQDPASFDAAKYYDNDNNLYMQVKKFDKKSLTGDLYREEKINAEYVDNAKEGDIIYSINGSQFEVVSFDAVNTEIGYSDTVEEFKKDVVGSTRFADFLVKDCADGSYYALEKEEYEPKYHVVYMLNEGNVRTLVEENVTFKIKENCEITLQKFVDDGEFANLETEYIIGREFKGDNYPGWSEEATEYYMTNDMLVALGVIDGELYNFVQIYIP